MSPMFTIAQALRQRMLRGRVCPVAVVGIATTPNAARLASSSRRFIMPVMPSVRSDWWLVKAGYTRRSGGRKVGNVHAQRVHEVRRVLTVLLAATWSRSTVYSHRNDDRTSRLDCC